MKPKVGRNFTSERGEGVKGEVKNISLHWLQGISETVPNYRFVCRYRYPGHIDMFLNKIYRAYRLWLGRGLECLNGFLSLFATSTSGATGYVIELHYGHVTEHPSNFKFVRKYGVLLIFFIDCDFDVNTM